MRYYRQYVVLSNDEIEVACDALWSVKRWASWDDDQERLWQRLQPIRKGDYGTSATIELKPEEEAAIVRALVTASIRSSSTRTSNGSWCG